MDKGSISRRRVLLGGLLGGLACAAQAAGKKPRRGHSGGVGSGKCGSRGGSGGARDINGRCPKK